MDSLEVEHIMSRRANTLDRDRRPYDAELTTNEFYVYQSLAKTCSRCFLVTITHSVTVMSEKEEGTDGWREHSLLLLFALHPHSSY